MSEDFAGDIIIYPSEDGLSRIECKLVNNTIWLSQAEIGDLFQRSKQTISEHLRNIFEERELAEESVVRNFRTTAADGKTYEVFHYNLEAVAADAEDIKTLDHLAEEAKATRPDRKKSEQGKP